MSGEWLVFCAKICSLKFSVVPFPSSLCLGSSVGLVYSIATGRYGEVSLLSAWLITKEEGD